MPMLRLLLAVAITLVALASAPLRAHVLQPGFIELRETAAGRYDVLRKLPSLGESSAVGMPIAPKFPERCRQLGDARSERAGTAWVFTARLECKGGLAGQTIAIEGLEAFATDVLVRVQHADGGVETHVLKPIQAPVTLRDAGDTRRGAWAYLYLGIEHILLGVDHLLFVLGLLHGFGFASGLAQLGLPKDEIPLALLLFNVGVETGQLAFVIAILLRGVG